MSEVNITPTNTNTWENISIGNSGSGSQSATTPVRLGEGDVIGVEGGKAVVTNTKANVVPDKTQNLGGKDALKPDTAQPPSLKESEKHVTDKKKVDDIMNGTTPDQKKKLDAISDIMKMLQKSGKKNGCVFTVHTPEYNTCHPSNASYKYMGFEKELDGTPGCKRARFSHPSGTSIVSHHNGDATATVKGKAQIISTEEIDLGTKDVKISDQTYRCQTAETHSINAGSFIVDADSFVFSGGIGSSMILGATETMVSGTDSALLTSNLSSAMTSNLACEVTAGGTVLIRGAMVTIEGLAGINLKSGGSLKVLTPAGEMEVSATSTKTTLGMQKSMTLGMKSKTVAGADIAKSGVSDSTSGFHSLK